MMYLAVFVGGALGASARALLVPLVPTVAPMTETFVVNVLACLLLGWLHAAGHRVHPHVMHLGAVGFCGGLSTFSTFVAEIARISVEEGAMLAALAPALEITVGIGAAAIGLGIGRRLHGRPSR